MGTNYIRCVIIINRTDPVDSVQDLFFVLTVLIGRLFLLIKTKNNKIIRVTNEPKYVMVYKENIPYVITIYLTFCRQCEN